MPLVGYAPALRLSVLRLRCSPLVHARIVRGWQLFKRFTPRKGADEIRQDAELLNI